MRLFSFCLFIIFYFMFVFLYNMTNFYFYIFNKFKNQRINVQFYLENHIFYIYNHLYIFYVLFLCSFSEIALLVHFIIFMFVLIFENEQTGKWRNML
jgi:hypothetical protein